MKKVIMITLLALMVLPVFAGTQTWTRYNTEAYAVVYTVPPSDIVVWSDDTILPSEDYRIKVIIKNLYSKSTAELRVEIYRDGEMINSGKTALCLGQTTEEAIDNSEDSFYRLVDGATILAEEAYLAQQDFMIYNCCIWVCAFDHLGVAFYIDNDIDISRYFYF